KWKTRMQLAAPWFAERIVEMIAQNNNQGKSFDGILTSTFLDVAVLRSLLAAQGIYLPLAIYFHENQFSYPGQTHDPGMLQFASINFNSALCADRLAFNSCYNLETFLDGICFYLKKSADMELCHLEEQIRKKSVILYPGIDFRQIDVQSEEIPAGVAKTTNLSLSGIIDGNMIKIRRPFFLRCLSWLWSTLFRLLCLVSIFTTNQRSLLKPNLFSVRG
ncbi:MAG: DUF3524 domain-containing protein, partial [Candidatus Electrothrix sp. AX5]|nr:DUF3524 domain-containing protein [Candidatus Electrothrix sp. AX5]